jgi:G3E family GTPase
VRENYVDPIAAMMATNRDLGDQADFDDSDDDDAPNLVPVMGFANEEGITKSGQLPPDELPPCPVTILSGFLGSGKTSLVQYILKSPDHGKRIAVIENEFGEGLSVESLIARDGINNQSLTDLIELPNGCICCTVKDSLVSTLENLLDKRKDLDYILIECSGMANPGPIASLFWLDEGLSRLRLDGIVTVVDAANLERQLARTEEAAQQIAYADRILLNKVDLVDETTALRLLETIRRIHPTAPVRQTQFAAVPDLEWILDASCFDADRVKDVERTLDELQSEKDHDNRAHSHSHDHSADICFRPHKHTQAVSTLALVEEGTIDLRMVDQWLAAILWPNQDEQDKVLRARLEGEGGQHSLKVWSDDDDVPSEIFRIKGILSVGYKDNSLGHADKDYLEDGVDHRRFIVQAVHDLWEIHPASDDLRWHGEIRCCKVVIVGRNLDENGLRQGFRSCFLNAGES